MEIPWVKLKVWLEMAAKRRRRTWKMTALAGETGVLRALAKAFGGGDDSNPEAANPDDVISQWANAGLPIVYRDAPKE